MGTEADLKKILREGRSGGGFGLGHLLRCLTDLLPEFVASGAGLGGEGKQAGRGIFLRQSAQGSAQLVVGEAVTLGGDEQEFAVGGGEEVEQLAVAFWGGTLESTRTMLRHSVGRSLR